MSVSWLSNMARMMRMCEQMAERYRHQNGAHIQVAMDKLEQRYQLAGK